MKKYQLGISNLVAVLLIILVAVLAGGGVWWWMNQKQTTTSTTTTSTTAITQKTTTTTTSQIDISDWQAYQSTGNKILTTIDWASFETKSGNISFLFKYPNSWKLDGSVFYEGDTKVAELSPSSAIQLSSGQKCYDVAYKGGEAYPEELIKQEDIIIGGLSGAKRVIKGVAEGGRAPSGQIVGGSTVYIHFYCLSQGNKAAIVAFWQKELNWSETSLFEKVMSTLKFQ